MKSKISSRYDGSILFESDGTLKQCAELAIKNKIDLQGANLQGAYLQGAYLQDAKIDDLMCINELQDAIDLAPMIFDEWTKNGIEAAQKKFGMYKVHGEKKALILMCPMLVGGFCCVLDRREIWWWSWFCPNTENVPVLWRESK